VQFASIVAIRSSPGNDAIYVEAGERLGSALAAAGVRLIYGGGTTGVMGPSLIEH
jgi:predicted Rossmann-fold nucleotide-binding protein